MFKEFINKTEKRREVKKMNKMKRTVLAAMLALTMGAVAADSASAFSFSTPYTGPVKIKYDNWETVALNPGDPLYGIFDITGIYTDDGTNTPLWTTSATEELTGYFGGFTLSYILPAGSNYEFNFTGGSMAIFLDSTPDFNATAPGSGFSDGSLFLLAAFTPGITADPSITLHSVLNSATIPFTGTGSGYANVIGGSHASLFDSNGELGGSDLFVSSNLQAPFGGIDGWPVGSFDPVKANVVPEPGTLVLLGSGLVGSAFAGRILRRRKKA